jgi:putative photosynthetic complex assembly protein
MSGAAIQMIPTKPFAAIMAGLVLTMAVIGSARLAGYEPPSSLPQTEPAELRMLQFEDASQGTVIVRDAQTQETIKSFARAEGSFVRATLRALVNHRKRQGIPLAGNFRLERHEGGQLFLIDEATAKTISLNAFGPANTAVFAAFLSTEKGEGQ